MKLAKYKNYVRNVEIFSSLNIHKKRKLGRTVIRTIFKINVTYVKILRLLKRKASYIVLDDFLNGL